MQEFHTVKSRKAALKIMPWASHIVKVCGGYTGFQYYSDYILFVDYKPNKKHQVDAIW